jgi:hypothetical protein
VGAEMEGLLPCRRALGEATHSRLMQLQSADWRTAATGLNGSCP